MVPSVGLGTFIDWTSHHNANVILVGHSAQAFDMRHLVSAVQSVDLTDRIRDYVIGLADTLPFCKKKHLRTVSTVRVSIS